MSSKDTVVYDGDCGICEASAAWISRHVPDVKVSSHREYGVTHLQSVWFVTSSERYEGAPAVAHILRRSDMSITRVCGRIIDAPVIRIVASVVYSIIARHRARISRLVGLKACGLPQNQPR